MPQVIGESPNRKATCRNCGRKLAFTLDEVQPGERIPGDDEGDHSSVIICPCGKSVDVTGKVGGFPAEEVARLRSEEDRYL
jgi:hypothetical protein